MFYYYNYLNKTLNPQPQYKIRATNNKCTTQIIPPRI